MIIDKFDVVSWVKDGAWVLPATLLNLETALPSFFVLRSNGDVSPCLRHYDLICGNMREDKLSALWKRIYFERGYVKRCDPQCLNDWAFGESMKSAYFPLFWFKLKKGNKQEVTA